MNWDDKKSVLQAVKKDGSLLKHASDSLKNDRDIVFEAIIQYENAFDWYNNINIFDWPFYMASKELQNDKIFIFQMVKQDGFLYRFASDLLLHNKYITRMAVKNRFALQFIGNVIKNENKIYIRAVKKHPVARLWVPKKLKKDRHLSMQIRLSEDDHDIF